jgi:hypothetical protein
MSEVSRPMLAAVGVAAIVIVAVGLLSFSLLSTPGPSDELGNTVLLSGTLQNVDEVHQGSGTVQLVELETGGQAIRFIDVSITEGPDLYVYLSKKSSFASAYDDAGEYSNLGLTPAITGNFTVPIPSQVDGTEYASVLIWCQTYAVLFTYAVFE